MTPGAESIFFENKKRSVFFEVTLAGPSSYPKPTGVVGLSKTHQNEKKKEKQLSMFLQILKRPKTFRLVTV
ncbi:hypothetical protein I7I50_09320 [Histoplasma capsulatum G186AR]|uniref:Uncharacterized protein n=1 Tax=Ajellomyces capsulatus TaxID=5037 RepID=A0A8H7YV90_AJECA|nr:hypothetical protein I7I52_06841 [Histoplasma capsulatum]QSS74231.1 hypothetical protein I7I50_09320 [Histoplasma capsulatum G186AR]